MFIFIVILRSLFRYTRRPALMGKWLLFQLLNLFATSEVNAVWQMWCQWCLHHKIVPKSGCILVWWKKETQIAALLPVLLILTFLKRRGLFVDFDSMFFCLRWEVKAVKAVVLFMVAFRYHSAARLTVKGNFFPRLANFSTLKGPYLHLFLWSFYTGQNSSQTPEIAEILVRARKIIIPQIPKN